MNRNKQLQKAKKQYLSIKSLQFQSKRNKKILEQAWQWMIQRIKTSKKKHDIVIQYKINKL